MLPDGEAACNDLYGSYKRNARNQKRTFELTREHFKMLVTSPCDYCGDPPSREYRGGKLFASPLICNGIDRRDNSKGPRELAAVLHNL